MTLLIHMCDLTHSYVCRDSCTRTREMPLAYVRHSWLARMTQLTHTHGMTRSHAWRDSFTCATWHTDTGVKVSSPTRLGHWSIHMCDITHLYVWHSQAQEGKSAGQHLWAIAMDLLSQASPSNPTLQHTATHCNTVHHTAAHLAFPPILHHTQAHTNTLTPLQDPAACATEHLPPHAHAHTQPLAPHTHASVLRQGVLTRYIVAFTITSPPPLPPPPSSPPSLFASPELPLSELAAAAEGGGGRGGGESRGNSCCNSEREGLCKTMMTWLRVALCAHILSGWSARVSARMQRRVLLQHAADMAGNALFNGYFGHWHTWQMYTRHIRLLRLNASAMARDSTFKFYFGEWYEWHRCKRHSRARVLHKQCYLGLRLFQQVLHNWRESVICNIRLLEYSRQIAVDHTRAIHIHCMLAWKRVARECQVWREMDAEYVGQARRKVARHLLLAWGGYVKYLAFLYNVEVHETCLLDEYVYTHTHIYIYIHIYIYMYIHIYMSG